MLEEIKGVFPSLGTLKEEVNNGDGGGPRGELESEGEVTSESR